MNSVESRIKGQTYSYEQFITWVEQLVDQGKTSGENQSEDLVAFTALNLKRMQRIDKTLKLNDNLIQKLRNAQNQQWWVLTEAWCGDSAQSLPILAAMAKASEGNIDLKVILRDEHPEIMEDYLTNGGKSIPKMVAFNENSEELFTWGPRPETAQQILLDWKSNPNGKTWEEFERELHAWYAKNKQQDVQNELLDLLT